MGTYTALDDPLAINGPGRSTIGFGINDLGQIVGSYVNPFPSQHGFLYSVGTFITLDDPLADGETIAYGINSTQIVGYYWAGGGRHGFVATIGPNLPPPGDTTAIMILRHGADGLYGIYDIGNNSILVAYQLAHVGTDWQFAGLGDFNGADASDMLLRNSTTGGFEVYNIANNNITNAAFIGTVGLEWQVMGFGNFGSFGETDMMLRNVNTGGLQVYNINNNQITGSAFIGAVGLNWQFSGVGNFSSRGTSDMLLRNSNTGGLEVYDINSNQITGAAFIGTVGLDWQFSGVGNFSGVPGETDLLLRNVNTGGLILYDIANNQITGAFFLGNVGLDWQYAGIAPIHAPGASDLVLRNVNTGAFQVYDIAGNTLVGSASLGRGRTGLAARRVCRQCSRRRHGQLRRFNLSARAGDGRLWRRQRRCRRIECRLRQRERVRAAVVDDAAARVISTSRDLMLRTARRSRFTRDRRLGAQIG
jgi:hypothetical protein